MLTFSPQSMLVWSAAFRVLTRSRVFLFFTPLGLPIRLETLYLHTIPSLWHPSQGFPPLHLILPWWQMSHAERNFLRMRFILQTSISVTVKERNTNQWPFDSWCRLRRCNKIELYEETSWKGNVILSHCKQNNRSVLYQKRHKRHYLLTSDSEIICSLPCLLIGAGPSNRSCLDGPFSNSRPHVFYNVWEETVDRKGQWKVFDKEDLLSNKEVYKWEMHEFDGFRLI